MVFVWVSAASTDVIRLVSHGDCNIPEGRVEVYHDGEWGTVCDDSWSTNDARVVCNQLGFTGGNLGVVIQTYGLSTVSILLDDVQCDGSEDDLMSCPHSPIGSHDCQQREDAGVSCIYSGIIYERCTY